MTFQTQIIRVAGPQDEFIFTAMGLVTDGAPLLEKGLMRGPFFPLLQFFFVATKACNHHRGPGQSRPLPSMRVMTVNALTERSRVLHLGRFDLLLLLLMAGNAQLLRGLRRQYYFPILRRFMADLATLVGERRVEKLLHQLGRSGLMRIMTADAISLGKGLAVMRFDKRFVVRVVAVEA